MNSKSLRRLAADHGSLHTAGLPPNYLFAPNAADSGDLTSLDILLAGPVGTPYAAGVWRLHLDIPPTYPTAPPTATFRTRLWHPNIDEATGAVCVETLKRDWKSELRLRDVLVTISCLLIQPNPASALNEAAGKLASEDWAGFERRARLMTGIHAAVPRELVDDVSGAQRRGDDVPDKAKGKSAVKEDSKEKVKKVSATPTLRKSLDEEDEENRRKRSVTVEMTSSNSDDDWIPGPVKSPKAFPAARDNNIFGIRGLDDAMQLDSPQKPRPSSSKAPNHEIIHDHDISDPFITVSPKRPAPTSTSFNLRIPPPAEPTSNSRTFSHPNSFSAIQTAPSTTRPHPLLTEFSWSWQDSEILHGTGTIKDGPSKADVLKRMAGADFEQQRKWEMKRFKKTGYDLAKYNRGDFGPRTGIARL